MIRQGRLTPTATVGSSGKGTSECQLAEVWRDQLEIGQVVRNDGKRALPGGCGDERIVMYGAPTDIYSMLLREAGQGPAGVTPRIA